MKVLFAGPSLAGADLGGLGLDIRRPARQGDIARAVLDGAAAIGLVDGVFEHVAAVWHKEILYALSEGVAVCGAASMGALRAAECCRFGMVGVGRVFAAYAAGALADDAAVAQLHAPEELGSGAITEALVNVEATLAHLVDMTLISPAERQALLAAARRLFFKERSYERVVAEAELPPARRREIDILIAAHQQNIKRGDALELVEYLRRLPDERNTPVRDWRFVATPMWRSFIAGLAGGASVAA
jgi:hypothetical protein